MHRFRILFLVLFLTQSISLFAQPVRGRIRLTQGQVISINTNLKAVLTQQAMNQAIDLQVDGNAVHQYTVTNMTAENYTVHHQLIQLSFNFEGMGQKRAFDSKNEKDLSGDFGKPVRELLALTYDMVIDTSGKVLKVMPDSLEVPKMDDPLTIISSMLTDLLALVKPPAANEAGFFKVLPDQLIDTGYHWRDSVDDNTKKSVTDYVLKEVNDTTLIISFTGQSTTVTKSVFMGNETVTTMNHKTTGNIMVDRNSGLIREKTTGVESNGATEAMGGKLPVTSRSTIGITVK